ncbi:MAG: hypothetical protein IPG50_39130 [Myxococcales bacterium]|nr:hypothetical protein [Myxococcales bacterium]
MSLAVRRGARFTCHGDGVCCSDVHALGPLSFKERARVAGVAKESVTTHPRLGLPVLATRDAYCTYFEGDRGCALHRERGAAFKPLACRRFPFSVVATPKGRRLATAHRCPCRSVGERALLEGAPLLRDLRGAKADLHVAGRVALTKRRRVGFDRYAMLEAPLLDRLLGGSLAASSAMDAPLPEPAFAVLSDVALAHRSMVDGTSSGAAMAWFGDALLAEATGTRVAARQSPFARGFDRAERRSPSGNAGDAFGDFAADVVFGLSWTEESSLGELLVRLEIALRCARRLAARSPRREDVALAEAVAVVEVAMSGPFGHIAFKAEDEAAALVRHNVVPRR